MKYLVSTFSEDMIEMSMLHLPKVERDQFKQSLQHIRDDLATCPKRKHKKTKGKSLPSKEELFKNDVIPLISRRIAEYERQTLTPQGEDINLDLKFNTDFNTMSLEEKISTHGKIMDWELNNLIITNLVKYLRGQLYISMRGDKARDEDLKQFYIRTLNLSYETVNRHISYTCQIRTYPKLIVSLSFNQLQLHQKRFTKFCSENTTSELFQSLSSDVCIITNGRVFHIKQKDAPIVEQKFDTSADQEILDKYQDMQEYENLAVDPYNEVEEELRGVLLDNEEDNDCDFSISQQSEDELLKMGEAVGGVKISETQPQGAEQNLNVWKF